MKCITCGYELPDGAKFCTNCGTSLARTVPSVASSAQLNFKKKYVLVAGALGIVAVGIVIGIIITLIGRNNSAEPIATDHTVLTSREPFKEETTKNVNNSETSTDTITVAVDIAPESSESPNEQTLLQDVTTSVSESTAPAWISFDLPDGSHSEVPDDCLADLEAFIYSSNKDMWWNQLSLSVGGNKKTLEGAEYYENFYSYDTSIATVSENGIVSAVNPGTTYIVADRGSNSISGRMDVHVFIIFVHD